jgi:hypothetical protein
VHFSDVHLDSLNQLALPGHASLIRNAHIQDRLAMIAFRCVPIISIKYKVGYKHQVERNHGSLIVRGTDYWTR